MGADSSLRAAIPGLVAPAPRRDAEAHSRSATEIAERSRRPLAAAQRGFVLHGGEACVTISISRAERADLGQRGAQPGTARRRTHAEMRALPARIYMNQPAYSVTIKSTLSVIAVQPFPLRR